MVTGTRQSYARPLCWSSVVAATGPQVSLTNTLAPTQRTHPPSPPGEPRPRTGLTITVSLGTAGSSQWHGRRGNETETLIPVCVTLFSNLRTEDKAMSGSSPGPHILGPQAAFPSPSSRLLCRGCISRRYENNYYNSSLSVIVGRGMIDHIRCRYGGHFKGQFELLETNMTWPEI